jgi:hypothetical protein
VKEKYIVGKQNPIKGRDVILALALKIDTYPARAFAAVVRQLQPVNSPANHL